MTNARDRAEKQAALVETMRGRLRFEVLVLRRLRARSEAPQKGEPVATLREVLDRARERAAAGFCDPWPGE